MSDLFPCRMFDGSLWVSAADVNEIAAARDTIAARLAEAEALLREIREDAPHFGMPTTRIDAFLAADSASGTAWIDPEPMVSYGHMNDKGEGIRFRQYKKDPLPPWAVDVRDEAADQPGEAGK